MDRREKIVAAAADCFLKAGFAETSLDEIVANAGVVKQTLYNYFENKETLFKESIALLTRQTFVELDASWYQLPAKEFLLKVGERQLHQFRDPRATDFLRLLVKECRKYPELQDVYSLSIPEPTIKFIAGYFYKGEAPAQLRRVVWCFRASLTGYATLSNLGSGVNFNLPNQSQYLDFTASLFERLFDSHAAQADANDAIDENTAANAKADSQHQFEFKKGTDKRSSILVAALETFSTTGFAESSMEEVANAAKTSKQTLYKYFKSKNELYTGLCDDVVSQLRDSSMPPLRQHDKFANYLIEYSHAFIARMRNPWLREYFRMVIGESRSFPSESGALLLYLFSFGTELLEAHIPKSTGTNANALAVVSRGILGSFLLAHQIYSVGDAPYINEDGLLTVLKLIAETGTQIRR